MNIRIFFFAILLFFWYSSSAQIGIQTFEKGKFTYKKLLDQSKKQDALLLLILYAPEAPMVVLPKISDPEAILANYNLVTDVADPFVEMLALASERLRAYSNPAWVVIHPDNFTIGLSSKIENDQNLKTLLDYGSKIKAQYDEGKRMLEVDKNDPEALKKVVLASANSFEKKYVKKYINRFIKNKQNWSDEDLRFITDVTQLCACSARQEDVINQHRRRIEKLESRDKLMDIDRQMITDELSRKGLYEPYMIWKRFEKQFGANADSLYRLEAIKYFNLFTIDHESLITEMVDFIALYPRTPWKTLDPMYEKVLSMITAKEDLELLQDLIEGQLFLGVNYRKLDYKSLILYRLGKKEKSLALMDEIRKLAFAEGVNYKSMIHGLKKK